MPEHWGEGIGTALLATAETELDATTGQEIERRHLLGDAVDDVLDAMLAFALPQVTIDLSPWALTPACSGDPRSTGWRWTAPTAWPR